MKNLLIVGGAGRNVGKTEFICRLIKKISKEVDIYALKVSAVFPDEDQYHGNHDLEANDNQLIEEQNRATQKDTSRMLQAGAKKVFYLRAKDITIKDGFEKFITSIPVGSPFVCESNSLEKHVTPSYHIMVKSISGRIKPRAIKQIQNANLVVTSDGKSGFPELDKINYDVNSGWQITE